MNLEFTDESLVDLGRQALSIEIDGLRAQLPRLGSEFARGLPHLSRLPGGRIVVTGMGKSGHIGGKIAATLASTGTPAFFMHPGEASHGDCGHDHPRRRGARPVQFRRNDEILTIVPAIARLGVPLIALTGNANSALARIATVHLGYRAFPRGVPAQPGPHRQHHRGVGRRRRLGGGAAEGSRLHRGRLRPLTSRRHSGPAPVAARAGCDAHRRRRAHVSGAGTLLAEGLMEVTRKGLGMTAIVDEDMRVLGVFTDGDLRRALDASTICAPPAWTKS